MPCPPIRRWTGTASPALNVRPCRECRARRYLTLNLALDAVQQRCKNLFGPVLAQRHGAAIRRIHVSLASLQTPRPIRVLASSLSQHRGHITTVLKHLQGPAGRVDARGLIDAASRNVVWRWCEAGEQDRV
jgi:hypothetical protein